jgi:hypothetical protein
LNAARDVLLRVREQAAEAVVVGTRVNTDVWEQLELLLVIHLSVYYRYPALPSPSPTCQGNGWYRIKATSSLCMGVRESRTGSGTDVLLWWCGNISDQLFSFVWSSSRGAYTIRPAHASGMCVDISSSSTANGARVQIWTCNDSSAQMFSLAP